VPELNESTEMTNELIMDSVKGDEAEREPPRWHSWVAITTLLMATFIAFAALMAGITAHEALLHRTEEVMAVSIRESDRLNVAVLKAKHDILISQGEKPDTIELMQVQMYERSATEFAEKTSRYEDKVQALVIPHLAFSIAVTLLSVGIALSGMAIIVEHQLLWYIGIVFGIGGIIGLGTGIFTIPYS